MKNIIILFVLSILCMGCKNPGFWRGLGPGVNNGFNQYQIDQNFRMNQINSFNNTYPGMAK